MTASKTAGIILAGGQSRRMGTDKALLRLPGISSPTYLAQLLTVLSSSCSELLLVVRDADQAALYAPLLTSRVRLLVDNVPDVGPLMGLYTGLQAMHSSCAFVTAVDTPLLQPALLDYLFSHYQPGTLLVPVVADIPQVLQALYPRAILPWLEQRLAEGRRDPRSLLSFPQVVRVDEPQLRLVDPQLRSFVNVNTPEELAHLSDLL